MALTTCVIVTKIGSKPLALGISKGRPWLDKPVLSGAEGLTTNGVLNVSCSNNSVFILCDVDGNPSLVMSTQIGNPEA